MERIKKRWEDETLIHIGRRTAHTDFLREDYYSRKMTLNGEWDFLFLEAPEYSPEGFSEEGFLPENWNTITVPSCWQTEGFGKMHYTDVWYLFPINPPFVPSKNPTGIYRRNFFIDSSWNQKKIILEFAGVDSAFDLWINGQHCGYSKVSRLISEFDISSYIKEGTNQITVRVYQWSDGTYLEDQDMWWLSGIFRDVTIYSEATTSIRECIIEGDLKNEYMDGELKVKVEVENPKENMELRWELYRNEKEIVSGSESCNSGNFTFEKEIEGVAAWTAETPNLYELRVTLVKEGEDIDGILTNVGFRKVEVLNQNFTINGKVILLNGVNMHDYSPTGGRTVLPETVEEDIILMKKNNINAVRCAHYPKMSYFYNLCDIYGLYVIDEADLETHGFEWVQRYRWLNEETSWEEAYVDRILRMVQHHRNHPSIIMWSMGNESDIGPNFKVAAEKLKELDGSRLVHYESDFEADMTDVYSTMYTRLKGLKEIAVNNDSHGKPHILCEYAHAMGNGPGNLEAYQELFRKYKRLQGGFIWEWYDHGIAQKNEDGEEVYRYGGNYGDEPNNSNFCIDGLLMSNRALSPGLLEYKQVISPVRIVEEDIEDQMVKLINAFSFLKFDYIHINWAVCYDETVIERGVLKECSLRPGEEKKVKVPYKKVVAQAGTDYYLNFTVTYKEDTLFAKAGEVIYKKQFLLPFREELEITNRSLFDDLRITENTLLFEVENSKMKVAFHKVTGKLLTYEVEGVSYIKEGPQINILRATIDNDMYKEPDWNGKYFLKTQGEQLETIEYEVNPHKVIIRIRTHFSCWNQTFGFKATYQYEVYSDGEMQLKLSGDAFKYSTFIPEMIPRVGIELKASKKLNEVSWYGLGPGENYSDSREAVQMGIYKTDVEGMHTDYLYPQENGHREQVSWLAVGTEAKSLLICAKTPIGINVHDYTIEDLEKAKHTDKIKRTDAVVIHIDAKHSGLGSNSCGEEQTYENRTRINDFSMELRFVVVDSEELIRESKIKNRYRTSEKTKVGS